MTLNLCNSKARMAFVLSSRKNSPMQTIEEVRRARLAILESEAGSQTKLADLLGKSPAQLSQWKNASTSSTGRERAMSSDAARSIEEKMGKPRGWMDTPLTYAEMHPNDRIAHAMMVMDGMTPYQLDQAVRVLDTLAQPGAKNGTTDS